MIKSESFHEWNCLALVGPTASGKSHLAMELAKAWPIEIISMDSALVYKGMDIGTAKPLDEDLSLVPHHLINIIEPWESYSAAQFANDALKLISDIRARQKIPVLVGGTFLYYKALRNGLDDLPSTNPAVRSAILEEAKTVGWPAMHLQLKAIDPVVADRLAPNDAQRIGRAIEVWRMTGQRLSEFQRGGKSKAQSLSCDLELCVISLEPQERKWLHERIDLRYSQMVKDGFLWEALKLFEDARLSPEMSSTRCVGYRQAWELLTNPDSLQALRSHSTLEELGQSFLSSQAFEHFMSTSLAATRQLAKRQLTWLRSMPERMVIHCDQEPELRRWCEETIPLEIMPLFRGM